MTKKSLTIVSKRCTIILQGVDRRPTERGGCAIFFAHLSLEEECDQVSLPRIGMKVLIPGSFIARNTYSEFFQNTPESAKFN
ncbi:MAG: hypothetical protein K5739_03365, partial [Lachnospiraceae bacterium]|nr:hypothetical protein [Lachnospiraceae bacterium]